jgi:dodecin
MSNHVYKRIEITGSSTKNIEDAVSTAIAKASTSVRNIDWFEVIETRGHVENGKVAQQSLASRMSCSSNASRPRSVIARPSLPFLALRSRTFEACPRFPLGLVMEPVSHQQLPSACAASRNPLASGSDSWLSYILQSFWSLNERVPTGGE